MQVAFCTSLQSLRLTKSNTLLFSSTTSRQLCTVTTPTSSSKPKRKSPKPRRSKRPRSQQSNTPLTQSTPLPSTPPPSSSSSPSSPSPSPVAEEPSDLQKTDKSGITLENRLREEIAHPLRKPKLTLFAALAFSGTLGFFFALARLQKDSPVQVAQNVVIDLAAIALFSWLAWREVQFGRRSLNSLAGRPEARDLQVVLLGDLNTLSLPLVGGGDQTRRLGELFKANELIIVAGRAADLRKYLDRCSAESSVDKPRIVALPTDLGREEEEEFEGAIAVASGKTEYVKDWIAWVGDAVPPRKNIAMFKIPARDDGLKSASSYVVAVSEPSTLPLPVDAKRELSEV